MAWLNTFKLGLPCKESSFELNPTAMDYTPRRIGDFSRGQDGTGLDVNTSRNRPLVRIDGNYISPAQRNQFEAMLHIDHVPLIFRPVNFTGANLWETWVERVFPDDNFTFTLPQTSATRAAQVLAAAGCGTGFDPINILGVWDGAPAAGGSTGTGTDWWDGSIGTQFQETFDPYALGNLHLKGPWTKLSGPNDIDVVAATAGFDLPNMVDHISYALLVPPQTTIYTAALGSPLGFTLSWKESMASRSTGTQFLIRIGSHATDYVAFGVYSVSSVNQVFLDNGGTTYMTPIGVAHTGVHTYRVEYLSGTTLRMYMDGVLQFSVTPPLVTADVIRLFGVCAEAQFSGTHTDGSIDTINMPGYATYFDSATSKIHLNNPLPDLDARWISYQYAALAVHLDQVPARIEGGWVNKYRYNFQLEGM